MTLRTFKDNLKLSSWQDPFEETFASLPSLEQPVFDGLGELLLAVALGDSTKDIRGEARKILRKRGNESVQKALKLAGSRNYNSDTGRKKLPADLAVLEDVEGFDVAAFAKYVYLRDSKLKAGLDYFFQHATREAFREYFQYDRVSPDGTIAIKTAGDSPGLAVEALFDVLASIEEHVVLLEINSRDAVDLDFSAYALPNMHRLVLRLPLDTFPKGLFNLVHLRQLFLLSTLEEIPEGLGQLKALESLGLGCPIRRLPDDFRELRGLASLNIDHSKLESLPGYLGEFTELTSMFLRNNTLLSQVPASLLDLPRLSQGCKQHIRESYFSHNEYEKVFDHLAYFVTSFNAIPSVKATIDAYEERQDCGRLGEVLLATSRCYYDDEHGLSSNDLYRNQIDQDAPARLKEANRKIAGTRFIDERTTDEQLDALRSTLGEVEGFDADVFIDFVKAMVDAVSREYPFEKQ